MRKPLCIQLCRFRAGFNGATFYKPPLHAGKRIVLDDWAEYPACSFPCRATDFVKMLTDQPTCPLCCAEVAAAKVKKLKDAIQRIRQMTSMKPQREAPPPATQ